MLEQLIDFALAYVVGPVVGGLMVKWLGAAAWARAKKRAIAILGDKNDPITSPRDAVKKAVQELFFERMERDIADIERMQSEGKVNVEAIEAQARADREAGNVPQVTIVPRDGTEEFRSPWKDRPK